MNGNTLSGSTANCFSLSGGNTNSNVVSTAVLGAGSTITVTGPTNGPMYSTDTPVISMAASPTCSITGSTGAAAASMATATNLSEWNSAGGSVLSSKCRYNAFALNSTIQNYPNAIGWNTAGGSLDCNATGSEIDAVAYFYPSSPSSNTYSAFRGDTIPWTPLSCPGNCKTQNVTDFNNGVTNFVTYTASPGAGGPQFSVLATGLGEYASLPDCE